MKLSYGFAATGTTLMLAAAQGHAQFLPMTEDYTWSVDKLYLGVDGGIAIPQNTAVQVSPLGNSGNVKFDAGMRAGLTLGYDVLPPVAVELQTGVIWNPVQSIQDNTLSSVAAKADLYQIPILANIIYKPLDGKFKPYIGLGCGGAVSIFTSTGLPLFSSSFGGTDFAFAYQAEAGFKYVVSDHVDLGLGYKFMGTTGHDWEDQGVAFKTDGTRPHSILAAFTWRF